MTTPQLENAYASIVIVYRGLENIAQQAAQANKADDQQWADSLRSEFESVKTAADDAMDTDNTAAFRAGIDQFRGKLEQIIARNLGQSQYEHGESINKHAKLLLDAQF